MAQKFDCVMSAMCWWNVLLEDKHVSGNAADQWQQFLHQQHLSTSGQFNTRPHRSRDVPS